MSVDTEGLEQYIQNGTINVDEIVGVGARVPAGRYVAKLIAVEGKMSKKDKPMIEARYEIQEGKDAEGNDRSGDDLLAFYSLAVTAPKKKGQRPFAPGIVEMKTAFAAVGAPLPAGYGFPIDEKQAAKLFAKQLGKKLLDIAVLEEKTKDKETNEERINTRVKILGLAKKGAAAAAPAASGESTSSVDDLL